jgi:hypothetical protein
MPLSQRPEVLAELVWETDREGAGHAGSYRLKLVMSIHKLWIVM